MFCELSKNNSLFLYITERIVKVNYSNSYYLRHMFEMVRIINYEQELPLFNFTQIPSWLGVWGSHQKIRG